MIESECADVDPSVLGVFPSQTVEVFPAHVGRLAEQERQAVVWDVVLVLQEVTQGQLCRCTETERHRGCDTYALVFDLIAVYDLVQVAHEVHTKGSGLVEPLVDVPCHPEQKPIPEAERAAIKAFQPRELGDLVDDTTRGPAPEVEGGRSLQHLDSLSVEHITKVGPLVAHAIQEEIVTSVKP